MHIITFLDIGWSKKIWNVLTTLSSAHFFVTPVKVCGVSILHFMSSSKNLEIISAQKQDQAAMLKI